MIKLIRLGLFITITFTQLQAQTVSNLAQALIQLRADVENLHTQLDDAKDEYRVRMKSLNVQRTDIEASIAREELKIKQIISALEKTMKRVKEKSTGGKEFKPVALEALVLLRAEITNHIPFKMKDRLEQIDELTTQINSDLVTPEKALNRVWSLYEDNFRMSHENGLFRQNVRLGANEYLADVVRIGTVMMYFKTSDDKVGYFTKESGSWAPKELVDASSVESVLALFDAMKKQIRSGYFILPYALNENEGVK